MRRRVDLWSRRALVVAPLGAVEAHAHAATAWLFGVDGSFSIRESDSGRIQSDVRSAVVPLGRRHALECGGTTMAVVMLSPGWADHRCLYHARGFADDGRVIATSPSPETLAFFDALAAGAVPPNDVERRLQQLAGMAPASWAHDDRVAGAAARIAATPEINLSLAMMAHDQGISPSRLQHLFADDLGVSPRRLRTWLRLRRAGQLVGNGCSLTEAAHEAGFADSAHFSRAFRKTFGLPPSKVLTPTATIVTHAASPAPPALAVGDRTHNEAQRGRS